MPDLPPRARYKLEEIPPASKQRRLLLFAKKKRHTRVGLHLKRGFEENGHTVLWLNANRVRRLLGTAGASAYLRWRMRRFRPDAVMVFAKDVPGPVFDAIPPGVPKAVFYEDAPVTPDPDVIDLARRADLMFTTARGLVPVFEGMGVPRAAYVGTGCDLTDHYPVEPSAAFASDVAFIGSAYFADRVELIRAIARRFPIALYGKRWETAIGLRPARTDVYVADYRKICSSSKIVVGIDVRSEVDLYFSNRTWFTLACGGFLLTRYVPNLEELFTNHEHLVWFRSPDECVELIEHYLPRENERRRIARAGCEYVRTYHTFRHATAEMMAKLFDEHWE